MIQYIERYLVNYDSELKLQLTRSKINCILHAYLNLQVHGSAKVNSCSSIMTDLACRYANPFDFLVDVAYLIICEFSQEIQDPLDLDCKVSVSRDNMTIEFLGLESLKIRILESFSSSSLLIPKSRSLAHTILVVPPLLVSTNKSSSSSRSSWIHIGSIKEKKVWISLKQNLVENTSQGLFSWLLAQGCRDHSFNHSVFSLSSHGMD